MPDTAAEALELFGQENYKNTAFQIIDFLSPVFDTGLIAELDSELIKAITDGSDEFELALPEIIATGVGTFRFEKAKANEYHASLSLELYRDALGEELPNISIEELKKHKIAAYSEAGDVRIESWSVYDAIVGSAVLNGGRYALNEGTWYRIDQAYKNAADESFLRLIGAPDPHFIPFRKTSQARQKGKKPKVYFQSEGSYNEERAQASGYLLLDQKLIEIPEEPGRGVEACDLLDLNGRRFIHVKKSSRQSSVLSHFFKQGANAAQMLRKYQPFREALVAKVRELYGAAAAERLSDCLDEKWTVEFQIADSPRRNGNFDIPFFSKLTLRDEARDMEAMQFNVSVKFIRLAADQ